MKRLKMKDVEGGKKRLLGNIRVNCRKKEKRDAIQRLTNYEQNQISAYQGSFTEYKSMRDCGRKPIPLSTSVDIKKSGGSQAYFTGMQTCGGGRCVRCQWKKQKKFMDTLDRALYRVEQDGGTIVTGVLTSSNIGINPADHLTLNQKAYIATLRKHRKLGRLMESMGYIDKARGTELMIDPKTERFHPHIHVALAFDRELEDEEIEAFDGLATKVWCEYLRKRGVRADHDQQRFSKAKPRALTNGNEYRYVAKGVAYEVGNGMVKEGKRGSLSFYGLLVKGWRARKAGRDEEAELYERLYIRTERILFQRRMVGMGAKLKELGKEPEDIEGEEGEEGDQVELMVTVPIEVFDALRAFKLVMITPQLCLQNDRFLEAFKALCDENMEAQRKRGYALRAPPPSVVFALGKLYGELIEMSLLDQMRLPPGYLTLFGTDVDVSV